MSGWTNEHLNCQKLVGLVDALGLEPEIATSTLTFHCSSSKLILWTLNLIFLPSKPFKSTCVVTQQSNLTARQRWCKLGLLVQFVDLVRSGCGAAFDQLFALLAPSSYYDDDTCKDCLCGIPHGKNHITTSLYSSHKTSLDFQKTWAVIWAVNVIPWIAWCICDCRFLFSEELSRPAISSNILLLYFVEIIIVLDHRLVDVLQDVRSLGPAIVCHRCKVLAP